MHIKRKYIGVFEGLDDDSVDNLVANMILPHIVSASSKISNANFRPALQLFCKVASLESVVFRLMKNKAWNPNGHVADPPPKGNTCKDTMIGGFLDLSSDLPDMHRIFSGLSKDEAGGRKLVNAFQEYRTIVNTLPPLFPFLSLCDGAGAHTFIFVFF